MAAPVTLAYQWLRAGAGPQVPGAAVNFMPTRGVPETVGTGLVRVPAAAAGLSPTRPSSKAATMEKAMKRDAAARIRSPKDYRMWIRVSREHT